MSKFNWMDITREDVIHAIERFLSENPEYPAPRSTFLLFEGKKLPAKHIRGMAYYEHYNIEISKNDYGGGMETVRFFKRLGFETYYTGASQKLRSILEPAIGEVTEAAEKNPKVDDTYQVAERREDAKTKPVTSSEQAESIKVAMYLQTNELKNRKSFDRMRHLLKSADADIIAFPENCYVPFVDQITEMDIAKEADQDKIHGLCLKFSSELGKAVIVSSHDKFDTIFSIYANAFAEGDETSISIYIKHTACGSSCLEFENYPSMAPIIFDPINYKGFLIGMTICYDCNHALFSRIYGIYGIDLIINSTGGNVVYDKWFKYNKARAIENNSFVLVTMGGDGTKESGHNYVYGFNPNGGQLQPENLNGSSEEHNVPGGLYVYEITRDAGASEPDNSNQLETVNKNVQFAWPISVSADIFKSAEKLTDHIYRQSVGKDNVFLFLVDDMDIMKPEKVQPLLYAKELKKNANRKYIIINRHNHIDPVFFREKLSVILKIRAMENFCAVILESDDLNKCYQCGMNRTSQVVRAVNGTFGIDLSRTSGPDAIWKNKTGMRASWRKNYEWLVENAEKLWEHSCK